MKIFYRALFYIAGIFCLAFSVTLSVSSGVGTLAGNMLPYVLSVWTGKTLSLFSTLIFFLYVLLQFVILKKDFKPLYLLELLFSVAFGYFVGITTKILCGWIPRSYLERLAQLLLSIILTGVGVACYVNTELVSMPPEAFLLAIFTKNPKWTLGRLRIIHDIVIVISSVLLSLTVFGNVSGFREGTVITAVLSGVAIDVFNMLIGGMVRKVCLNPHKEAII